ncbi:hypothetical protein PYCCODRAFT_596708 [Trametes coccinea BRFM310]|uniref:Uncharacterized protein n=1 Tax=Trametes coccinea (strain BRFM310) TaxID=1353009 RepID=A0A1Y2J1Q4_TRAC3|nr:hypothetical protein PYCCODRAFT_596708 [Trametes coccinea BRFM310]
MKPDDLKIHGYVQVCPDLRLSAVLSFETLSACHCTESRRTLQSRKGSSPQPSASFGVRSIIALSNFSVTCAASLRCSSMPGQIADVIASPGMHSASFTAAIHICAEFVQYKTGALGLEGRRCCSPRAFVPLNPPQATLPPNDQCSPLNRLARTVGGHCNTV